MDCSHPLFQCLLESRCDDEQEILSDLLWSFQEQNDYARIFYESGEAKGMLSKKCYEALKSCIDEEDKLIKEIREDIRLIVCALKANGDDPKGKKMGKANTVKADKPHVRSRSRAKRGVKIVDAE